MHEGKMPGWKMTDLEEYWLVKANFFTTHRGKKRFPVWERKRGVGGREKFTFPKERSPCNAHSPPG